MYKVYILKSVYYPKIYVGSTNDLERRLREHNSGKSIYTRRYKPWELVYSEDISDLISAKRREKYFKSHSGRKKIKKILNIGV